MSTFLDVDNCIRLVISALCLLALSPSPATGTQTGDQNRQPTFIDTISGSKGNSSGEDDAFPCEAALKLQLSAPFEFEGQLASRVDLHTTIDVWIASPIRANIIYGTAMDLLSTEVVNAGVLARETFTTDRQQSRKVSNSWFSFDKVQHVTFGFLFTLAYQYTLVNKLEMTENRALPLSLAGTAAVGLGKEVVDWKFRPGRHFDRSDLVADSIGMLLAVGLIVL